MHKVLRNTLLITFSILFQPMRYINALFKPVCAGTTLALNSITWSVPLKNRCFVPMGIMAVPTGWKLFIFRQWRLQGCHLMPWALLDSSYGSGERPAPWFSSASYQTIFSPCFCSIFLEKHLVLDLGAVKIMTRRVTQPQWGGRSVRFWVWGGHSYSRARETQIDNRLGEGTRLEEQVGMVATRETKSEDRCV
jgi:hypothetical protein